jgi:hypothetical protein
MKDDKAVSGRRKLDLKLRTDFYFLDFYASHTLIHTIRCKPRAEKKDEFDGGRITFKFRRRYD